MRSDQPELGGDLQGTEGGMFGQMRREYRQGVSTVQRNGASTACSI